MVTIRPATVADIPAMMKLEQQASAASHWSREQYAQMFAAGSQKRVALLVEDSHGVQGYVLARAVSPEWEIENVVVAGPLQRHGLGTELLRKLLAEARDAAAEAMFLEVRESNVPARALYRGLGFVESGKRKGYYQNPEENAVLYRIDFR